ncbi:metalloregulator ArsR/SmtB family transcription factor [Arenibaculum sp.]|jgi:ArsR family transcriptional regulator|uniref:ArsR/SmtB family transcription factor n=1 Tax=Arenibaculum sp. TaxID=2865862 RepID=UPI002E13BF6F|nr:metalloregulator ArsR/SmtB family transcription factor [Arenibaculum sp.]
MEFLLTALKAAAEPTRLRLMALCAHGELTVTELTQILGQSQPRVSRHLKLLCEAGLLDRFREGTWAFYRLTQRGPGAELASTLVDQIPADDPELALDLERLEAIKRGRAEAAARYFSENAARWHEIRSLHVPEREVEQALVQLLSPGVEDLLDIGTGTGRMIELFGPKVARAVGIDASREMLAVARANLEREGLLRNCQVRQADMYQLPFASGSFDAVVIHQVLHYCEEPAEAVAEAARVLRPGGQLLLVDFSRHDLDALRVEHAHRRLGFENSEIDLWFEAAGLIGGAPVHLPGGPLTVTIWPSVRGAAELPAANPVLSVSGVSQ